MNNACITIPCPNLQLGPNNFSQKKQNSSYIYTWNSCNHLRTVFLLITTILFFSVFTGYAVITIPGADGSDGVFAPTLDSEGVVEGVLTVDLGTALEANWDHPMSSEELAAGSSVYGRGVYDASKWAVVYKYESINIPEGVTIKFKNNDTRAPVVWLVSGDVTINGTVSLNGSAGVDAPGLAEPGPGGFRGGTGAFVQGVDSSAGFGPGGADFSREVGWGGSYGSQGGNGQPRYGNPSLIPLVGGSGGGGDGDEAFGGGAGGGALLVACSGTLAINGSLTADGGSGHPHRGSEAGGGSGGALRLIADTLTGVGILRANGGVGQGNGGLGRIRLERVLDTSSMQITPDPSRVKQESDKTPLLWPPDNAPKVKILSIDFMDKEGNRVEVPMPDDPHASFGNLGADAVLPEVSMAEVVIETTNVEERSLVQVRMTPRSNGTFKLANAEVESVISTDPLVVKWIAPITDIDAGYAAVQVKVVRP